MTTQFTATVEAVDALRLHGANGSSSQDGLIWLDAQAPDSTNSTSLRLLIKTGSGLAFTSDLNSILSQRNDLDGYWGADLVYAGDTLETSLAVQALKSANYTDSSVIYSALAHLTASQNSDGGWGFAEGDDSNVYVTSHVLTALAQYQKVYLTGEQIAKGKTFLLSRQHPDGGFGAGSSTVYETALSFMALMEAGADGTPLLDAVSYLTTTQSANGSWSDDPYSTALALRALAYVKPDLAIGSADIVVTPSTPTAGDSLTVAATLKNVGLYVAENVVVRLADNGVTVGEQTIATVAPGATATATFKTAALATGEHTLTVVIDPSNSISEGSKSNNSASLRSWVKSTADLVVMPEYLALSPAYPKPGESITLTASIANMGESAAGAFFAELYDGDPASGGTKLRSFSIGGIAAGEWQNGSTTFSLTTAGVHTLYLVLDPQNALSEENKANNRAAKSVTVSAAGGSAMADLAIGSVQLTPARPRAGDSTTVAIMARNLGTVAETAALELFDGLPGSGGVLLHQETVTINPGESRTVSVPWTATPGIHAMYAVIDRAGVAGDSDRSNNGETLPVMTDMVDIEISASDISIEPEHPMDGDQATVKVVIQNRGIASTGPFTVNLYNGDPASGGSLLQSFAVADMAGDTTQEIRYGFTAARGTYRFYAVCDSEKKVTELNENNNLAIRSLLVKSSLEAKGPDLVPLELDFSGTATDPQTLVITGMAKVKFQNQGDDKVATPFRVTIFEDLDHDGVYSEGTDSLLGFWDYASVMNPGMVGSVSINVSGILTFRDAPVYATVDSGQTVFEQNEGNNTIRRGSGCEARPAQPIEPVLKWQWRATNSETALNNMYSSPVVMTVSDGQGGKKTIVLAVGEIRDSDGTLAGKLYAFDGKTGKVLFTYYDRAHLFDYTTHIAVGDINNDGKVEILISRYVSSTGGPFGLICLSQEGTLLWDNRDAVNTWLQQHPGHAATNGTTAYPVIADLDGDGKPEILAGTAVINADGSVRSIPYTYNNGTGRNGTGSGNTIYNYPIVADLDLDGKLEIVAGNTAFDYTSAVKWFNPSLPDGINAILNVDDDPYPEIVFTTYGGDGQLKVYVLEHDGKIKWGPVYLAAFDPAPSIFRGGPPVVADFDGDGQPEIAIKGYSKVIILSKNGQFKGTLDVSANYSNVTPTVFDLNGDGRPEVMINSGKSVRILDGVSGTKLYETPLGTDDYMSYSKHQQLIVSDVDGDGHADIVAVGGYTSLSPYADSVEKGIKVFSAKNNDWVGARGVWNQASYHVTNVKDDGTIPRYEAPSWLTNNSYLCNVPTSAGSNPYLAADLSTSLLRVDMHGFPQAVAVTARIGNGGAAVVPAGIRIDFFDGSGNGALIGSAQTTGTLYPGDYQDVSVTWNAPSEGSHALRVVADADGTVSECNKANNSLSASVSIAGSRPDLSIAPEDLVVPLTIPEGKLASIQATVKNSGTSEGQNVSVRLFVGNPASGGVQIGEQFLTRIAAGGMATALFTWNTSGFRGTSYLYAVVDQVNAIAESNEANNTAIKPVTIMPALKPDLEIGAEDIAIIPALPREGDPLAVTVNVHNRGLDTGNVRVVLYNGTPSSGNALATTTLPQIIAQGGAAKATFSLDTVGLSGVVTFFIKVDPENLIDEADEANNVASQAVTIASAGLTVGLTTDKPSYSADEDIRSTITVADTKGQARALTYDIRIVDATGMLAAQAVTDCPLSLGANTSPSVVKLWNTGATVSGAYTEVVLIKEDGRIIAKAASPVTILPDKKTEAKIFTDKISYSVNDAATFTATLTSLSRNFILENLTVTLSIHDGSGGVSYFEKKSLSALVPGGAFTFRSYWNVITLPPGSYPLVMEVKDASDAVIASATRDLVVSSSIKPSAVLKGTVSVDRQAVLSGEAVNVAYNVTNTGGIDLSGVAFSVRIVHVANGTVYDTLTSLATLPAGQSYTGNGHVDTSSYTAKDYLVILRADIAGVEETLDGTHFRVEGAPSVPAIHWPADGADVDAFSPTLSISNAADPNDDRLLYELEVYSGSGLTNLIASSGTIPEGTGFTSWTVPVPLVENQNYYWRARAYDGRLYSAWTMPGSFRVNTVPDPPSAPHISSPADGTAVAVSSPLLTVTNAFDPDSDNLTYNFELALDGDFTDIVASARGVSSGEGSTSWRVPVQLEENRYYYWRAQADDWLSDGLWSGGAGFFVNTRNDPPSAPMISAPVTGTTIPALATDIVVVNSVDPDSASLLYTFEVDTVPTFDSPGVIRSGSIAQGPGTTSWQLYGLRDNTRYYIRSKASDGAADSPWSSVVTFIANTANDPPGLPTLANPSNGAGVAVLTPTLSVHNAKDLDEDVLSYDFELFADADLTQLVARADGIGETAELTSWTSPVPLVENRTYYWHARASDSSLHSAWTPAASFMVNAMNDAPGAPRLSSPATGASLATLTPTLAVVNAVDPENDVLAYDFEIYSGTSLVAGKQGVAEDRSGVTTWTSEPLADNTQYQWRARANDGDSSGPWTTMGEFTIHRPETAISATIDVDPDTVKKSSDGKWLVVYIKLPPGYRPGDIDVSSVRFEKVVPAEMWPYAIGDHDKDGVLELMVKFRRADVAKLLKDGDAVTVKVAGKVGSIDFEGVDVIRVIK